MADGPVNHERVTGNGGGDGHLFDAAGKSGQQGTLGRQGADVQGMEPGLVHVNRDFDTGAFRQVGDDLGVGNIAIELKRFTAFQGVDDIRGIFQAAGEVAPGNFLCKSTRTPSFQVASLFWYSFRI